MADDIHADAKKSDNSKESPRKPMQRSPNHPVIGIKRAVELAEKVQGEYGTHPVPVRLAHKLWEYKEGSGIADQCVAALKSYGLISVAGKGVDRKVVLTDAGNRIARKAPDRDALIRKSVMGPSIHREIVAHYGAKGIPNDALLREYLVWERPEGSRFNEDVVDAFIGRFKKDLEFSGATVSDIIGESSDDDADNGGSEQEPPKPPKGNEPKSRVERKRQMETAFKEDVYSLDEGSVILQWPERLSKVSADDLEEWLKLIGRKIKRAATAVPSRDPDEADDSEES